MFAQQTIRSGMDYVKLSDILGKFKKLLFKEEEVYKIISDIILKNTTYTVPVSAIKIKGDVVYLNCSPILRGEILMKKRQIITDLSLVLIDRKINNLK